jgi:hypothetical protein
LTCIVLLYIQAASIGLHSSVYRQLQKVCMVLHAGSCRKPVYCYIQAASEDLVLHIKTGAAGLYSAAYSPAAAGLHSPAYRQPCSRLALECIQPSVVWACRVCIHKASVGCHYIQADALGLQSARVHSSSCRRPAKCYIQTVAVGLQSAQAGLCVRPADRQR